MIQTIPIDPYTDSRWETFLARSRQATIFHHPAWLRTLQNSYGYKPRCSAFVEDGKVIGLLPLLEVRSSFTGARGMCLPFSDQCGPLLEHEEASSLVADCCTALMTEHRWRRVDIHAEVAHPQALPTETFRYYVIPLDPDPEKVFLTFRRTSVRQSISKAERNDVRVERRCDEEALGEFVRLNTLTRQKHGVPPQPSRFFRQLFRHCIATGHGYISLSRHRETVVAATVSLLFNKTIYCKYTGSDERALNLCPYHPMVWEMVKWGCENGYEAFDFGRTELTNTGLQQYKSGWGTVATNLQYVRFGQPERATTGRGIGLQKRLEPLMRTMPLPVLRLLGRMIYRHIA